jgi:N-terminal acetyltransferase B complex catalytic subunit
MAHLTPFRAHDLFRFNAVNLDHWTETYSLAFYLSYLATWPDLSYVQRAPGGGGGGGGARGGMMGYVIGKAEGREEGKERHGHVTAITVAPEYRRLGVAQGLMRLLERASAGVYQVRVCVFCARAVCDGGNDEGGGGGGRREREEGERGEGERGEGERAH